MRYLARMDLSEPGKNLFLEGKHERRRKVGCPKLRWLDYLDADGRKIDAQNWRLAALDRDGETSSTAGQDSTL